MASTKKEVNSSYTSSPETKKRQAKQVLLVKEPCSKREKTVCLLSNLTQFYKSMANTLFMVFEKSMYLLFSLQLLIPPCVPAIDIDVKGQCDISSPLNNITSIINYRT